MTKMREFTTADGLAIQATDLAKWKTVLNDAAYLTLLAQVEAANKAGYSSPYDVFRGQDLITFVLNLSRDLAADGEHPDGFYICDGCGRRTIECPGLGDVCKVCGGSDFTLAGEAENEQTN